MPIAGGLACFAEEGSPFNKVAELGFGDVPGTAALEEVERAFAARCMPVQIELAHLADPAIGALLTERGYRLASFENVLGLAFEGEPPRVAPQGIEVRLSGADELEAWLEVVTDGVANPDTQGAASHEEFARGIAREESSRTRSATLWPRALCRTSLCATEWSPGAPASGLRRASRSLRAQPPHRRTDGTGSTARCSRFGSPTPQPPAVTSPSSPPAGIEVTGERAASGLRFALYPRGTRLAVIV
jgi:hypothetical protein